MLQGIENGVPELLHCGPSLGCASPNENSHGAGGFLAALKSKHRAWIRRKERELTLAYPEKVEFKMFSTGDDVLGLCSELEAVASKSYQRALGAGFKDGDEMRARYHWLAERGRTAACVLRVGGASVGYWAGSVFGNTFHSSVTAYAQELKRFEVGNLLLVRVVDALAAEGTEWFDFGLGDAAYKERFGTMLGGNAIAWSFQADWEE